MALQIFMDTPTVLSFSTEEMSQERNALLMECGAYPDKGLSVAEEDLDGLWPGSARRGHRSKSSIWIRRKIRWTRPSGSSGISVCSTLIGAPSAENRDTMPSRSASVTVKPLSG